MDLRALDRREKRKTIVAWILIPLAIILFILFWTGEEINDEILIDAVQRCMEIIENQGNYSPTDVDDCKKLLLNIIHSEDIFGKTHT